MHPNASSKFEAETTTPYILNRLQIAKHYGVSPRTLDTWRARRIIPFIKIGGVVRFRLADCDAALERYTHKTRNLP